MEGQEEQKFLIDEMIQTRRTELGEKILKAWTPSSIIFKSTQHKITTSERGSRFRGVSKIGKKWQVMVMGFAKKWYIGGISNEHEAAKVYDQNTILT